jgi:hypothetical protein
VQEKMTILMAKEFRRYLFELTEKHKLEIAPRCVPTDTLGSCAEEDCSGAESEMGKGEGGEEHSLILYWGF